ncbi:Serine/threonine protein kinase with TPR repeats [Planktothrix serta PCC 8927]|uniref:Serine/threonine protein kinase with TPR repeats n=1 Tax=Planktothrix serta PCC 8927 TaxID=671068 RepID=A0A7Z9BY02_9CYAN|nr:serine/threonine-protein kinase [Planktothrix serta]VXD23486.1 Serine/threonine protein kinase with TPR repeats [Planktothrix serta PCC 8927]
MLGTTLGGRYHILQSLGGGGFARTYLAEDRQLPDRHQCVVKQLKPHATNPTTLQIARRLFETEAQVLYRLGYHEQIPQLFAFFEEDQEFYLVQEFIEGHDLSQELIPAFSIPSTQPPQQPSIHSSVTQVIPNPLKGRFNEAETIILLQDILKILDFVHKQNVIHRDISPKNLIRRKKDNQLVLIDFGAVKQITTQMLNSPGQSCLSVGIGTPGYMPSEQARGNPKPSSDVYAVGMIGIQALTGIAPHQLPSDPDTEEMIWQNQAIVSPEFAEVINKMVRYDFRQRYSSATEALEAIKSLNQPTMATIPAIPLWLRPLKIQPSKPKIYGIILSILGLIGLGTGTGIYLWQSLQSSNAIGLHHQGNTLYRLNRYPEALKRYDQALNLMPTYKEAWKDKGQILYQLEQYSQAQEAYDKAIQIDPNYTEAWIGRGKVLNALQNYPDALTAFEQAIKQNPDAIDAGLGKGNVLLSFKRYEEAIQAYKEVLDRFPSSFEALYKTGKAYHDLEDYEQAFKAYDQAVEVKINDPNAWYNRGNVLMQMKRYGDALESYDKAVRFNPNFYQAWYSRGNALLKKDKEKEAIESFRQAVKIQPNYYQAWYSLGWSLHQLQRYEEAITAYNKALEINKNDHLMWYNIGNSLYNLGRYQEAIASYDEAIYQNTNHAESWYSRGNAFVNLNQYPEAISSYQKALQYRPDYREATQAKQQAEKQLQELNTSPNSTSETGG